MKNSVLAFLVCVCLTPVARAEEQLAEIADLVMKGRAAEARPRLAKALEDYRATSDLRGEAAAILLTAFTDVALHDRAQARRHFELAAEQLAKTGDRLSAWMALLCMAGADMFEEKWESAAESHQKALAMLSQTDGTPFTLEVFIAIGPLFGMDMGPIAPLMSTQPEFMKPFLLRMAEMMTRDALGSTYVQLGRLTEAEEELRRASDLSAMFFGMYDASVVAHVGDLRRRQWRFDEAKQNYQKALASVSAVPVFSFDPDGTELSILDQLSDIELLSGRLDEALAWNDRALELVRKQKKPAREALKLDERATLLTRAGRFPEALQVLGEARKLVAANSTLLPWIVARQGALQMYAGNYGEAAATLEHAIDLYRKLNKPDDESFAWLILSQVYLAMAADDSAEMAMQRVFELTEKSKSTAALGMRSLVSIMRNLSANQKDVLPEAWLEAVEMMCTVPGADPVAMRQLGGNFGLTDISKGAELVRFGKVAEARALWQSALEKTESGELRSGYLGNIAATYWREGKIDEAIHWFQRAVESLERPVEQIGDDELLARYFGGNRRWYYELTIEVLADASRSRDAFDYAERARSRAFLQLLGNHRLAPGRGGSEALLREAEALRVQIAEWERRGSPIASDLAHARERYRLLLRRIKSSNPEYASLTTVEPLGIREVQRELPPNATLVSYFSTMKRMHIWIVGRDQFHHVTHRMNESQQRRTLCWARRFLPAAGPRGVKPRETQCEAATAEELYRMLVEPVRNELRTRRLIIVPHGPLHYIPFGALRDPESGRFLIDDFTLSYAPSASSLRFLRAKETSIGGLALVLGNPDGDMGTLPGAHREAEAVARHLGTTAITGVSATESLLYDLRSEIDLVHIGAHGRYVAASPTFSRIALAAGGGRDGNLEVHEILGELDLSGVNLVVLSACQTALGERSGGDDVVGLTRAILYAGSPGVISTLWDIDDDAAAILMDEFYCHLRSGVSVADALREAQLALRRNRDYSDPRFWAAFVLTGDPQGRWTH